MAYRITLPSAGTRVLGGVQFVDGVAVAEIGPNLREYFTDRGADIQNVETRATRERAIKRYTKEQLLEYASQHDIAIDEARTNAEILADILDAQFPQG